MEKTNKIPLLSVIVPAYNAENYIGSCIDSLVRQTYSNKEIIIIDDGSTDKTFDIAKTYSEKYRNVYVLHQENGGPSEARNTGIKKAQGKYLAFFDVDDGIEVDMYEQLISRLENDDTEMAICRWEIHDEINNENRSVIIGNPGVYDAEFIMTQIVFEDVKYGGGFPWNRVVNYEKIKDLFGDDVFFQKDISLYEDCCWNMQVLSCSNKVSIIDYIGYHYYIRSGSLTRKISLKKREMIFNAWDKMADILIKKDAFSEDMRGKFLDRYYSGILYTLRENKGLANRKWKYINERYGYSIDSAKKMVKVLVLKVLLGKGCSDEENWHNHNN